MISKRSDQSGAFVAVNVFLDSAKKMAESCQLW